jgi:oligoendopeptidase F
MAENETWNLEHLFAGKTEKEITEKINNLKNSIVEKKTLLTEDVSPDLILELIKKDEELDIELSRITAYYALRSYADLKDEEANAKLDYYRQLASEIDNETMFFDLWFIALKDEKAQRYINSETLKTYKQYLIDLIKIKPYTKSEEIEQILNIKNITGRGAFSIIYDVLCSSFKYELLDQKDLTQEEIVSKYTDPDPKIREEAYKSVLGVYKENSTTLSEIYKNIVLDWNNENLKIRNYKKAIEPRNISNDLTDEAVQIMIQVIRENISIFHEYFKLKQEFLEKKGHPHKYSRFHVYAPYNIKKEYSYDESKKICLETFKEFDEEFYAFAKKIFDEKHIHSHPQKNKRSGAFCYGPNNQTTPYILLNHTNKIRDVFIMMHELGHGIHDLYAYKNPNSLVHPVLPLAETASILSETILSKKLLQITNEDDDKASLLMHLMDHYYASIIRQNYFILFEEIAHKKIMQGVTKKELDEEYSKLLKEQFADMEIDELFKHEWNYIPHIHHSPFYCYAYSWGNLLVLALYAEYEKNPAFKEKSRIY